MITEDQIIAYYENLSPISFFHVEDPEDLENFDQALRAMKSDTALLICAMDGEFNDMGSENHVQTIDLQIFILKRKSGNMTIPAIRSSCMNDLISILGSTKKDARKHGMVVPFKKVNFLIDNMPVRKVGPMNLEWYGYTAFLQFTCPFGF